MEQARLKEITVRALEELEAFIDRAEPERKAEFVIGTIVNETEVRNLKTGETKDGYILEMYISTSENPNGPKLDSTFVRFTKDQSQEEILELLAKALPTQEEIDKMKAQAEMQRKMQEQLAAIQGGMGQPDSELGKMEQMDSGEDGEPLNEAEAPVSEDK